MKKLLAFTVVTLAVSLLPVLWLRGDLWLPSDFVHQELAFILETKRMLATGVSWWSWNTYLGADFIGSYAFYTLTSPFVWINCLFPEQWVPFSVAITFVLKFLCMAWLSWLYLCKMGVSRENSALGAFLFTFSSFNIASLYYYHFYEPIIAFVLLLIALERLLRRERWGMTCVALAAFAVTFVNFYFAIGSFIAALIYVIFRAFSSEINFNFKIAIKGLASVSVGIAMCAFLLLPIYYQMLETTRSQAQNALDHTAVLNLIERFRTLLMPKVVEGTTIFVPGGSASYSNEACIAVFGLSLALIYAWRHRNWLSALLVAFLFLYLTPLNGIFTLLTNPLYTRWAYALTLVIVLCTVRTLDDSRSTARGVLVYSVVASVVVLLFVASVLVDSGWHIPGVRFMALILLFFVGLAMLLLWSRGKLSARWLKLGVVGCVVVQMWLFLLNLHSINEENVCGHYMDSIEQGSGVTQYRTDFRAHESDFLAYNLGLLSNRAAVQSYHSVIDKDVDVFMRTATRDFGATNKIRFNVHRDEMDALLSVKDVYEIDSMGNISEHENKYFIPFGFAYDKYMPTSDFYKMRDDSTKNMPLMMLAGVVMSGSEGCLQNFDYDEPLDLDSLVAKRREYTATDFKGNSRGFTAKIELPSTKMVFFSVPYSKGFTARIDGKEVPIHIANWCMMALKIPAGKHSIAFNYFPLGLKTGACISLVGLLLLLMIVWNEWKKKQLDR